MKNKNILISGGGIAGAALAFWLKRFGFNPTVVEIAPKPREGGYMIDFWGLGYEVSEKMGILSQLKEESYSLEEIAFVNDKNKRIGGLDVKPLNEVLKGRYFSILRSTLAHVLYDNTKNDIEYIFDDSIKRINETENEISVEFEKGAARSFDLLVGADGLHSRVREMVFGPEEQFEKFYGYYVASYTFEKLFENASTFISYTIPGKQVSVYDLRDNKQATMFLFKQTEKINFEHHDQSKQKEIIRQAFEGIGWKSKEILAKAETTTDFYFDPVSQIVMNSHTKGRVALAGDAGYCPSLLSGQGSSLAIAGAYVLAGELKSADGDHEQAFPKYEELFSPMILEKQSRAQKFATDLVPDSKSALWFRNIMINLMKIPYFSRIYWKKLLREDLSLKDY